MYKYLIVIMGFVSPFMLVAQNKPFLVWSKPDTSRSSPWQRLQLDKNKNLYLLFRQSIENPFIGYWLVKYNPAGTELWRQRYKNYKGHIYSGFTLDTLGNAYVGFALGDDLPGAPAADGIVIKYSPNGEELWVRNLSLNYGGHTQVGNLKSDALGHLFGVGYAVSIEKESDNLLFLNCLDTGDGHELWRLEIQGFFAVPNLRLLDDRMVVFVTEYRADGRYYRILQVDFTGKVLSDHAKPYFTGERMDFNFISKNGDVVFGNRYYGYNIARVNYLGDTLWTHYLPTCNPCRVLALSEDDKMSIYATGTWSEDEFVRLTTSKLSLQGTLEWQQTYLEGTLVSSGAGGIGVDDKYVYTIGSVESLDDEAIKMHVMVYDKDTGSPKYDIQLESEANWLSGDVVLPLPDGFFFTATNSKGAAVLTGRYALPTSGASTVSPEKANILSCQPNPAHGEAVLYYDALEAADAHVFFHDAQGRLLDIMDCRFTQGRNAVRLQNLTRLPEGIVNISVNDKKGIQSVRIIKQ